MTDSVYVSLIGISQFREDMSHTVLHAFCMSSFPALTMYQAKFKNSGQISWILIPQPKVGKVSTNFAAAKNGKVGSNFSAAKNGQVSRNSKKR